MPNKCWIIKKEKFANIERNQLGFFSLLSNWKLFKAWTRGIIFIFSDIVSLCNFLPAPRFSYPRSINLSYLLLLGKKDGNFYGRLKELWRSIYCLFGDIWIFFFYFNRSRLNNAAPARRRALFSFHYAFACLLTQ